MPTRFTIISVVDATYIRSPSEQRRKQPESRLFPKGRISSENARGIFVFEAGVFGMAPLSTKSQAHALDWLQNLFCIISGTLTERTRRLGCGANTGLQIGLAFAPDARKFQNRSFSRLAGLAER
jgi:hypothetical protein